MNKLIIKAEKKAVSALKKKITRCLDSGFSHVDYTMERYHKHFYLKELWKSLYVVVSAKFHTDQSDCSSLESVAAVFRKMDCAVRDLRQWIEIKMEHHTFRVLESDGQLYIVATGMDALPISICMRDLVNLVVAYDRYIGNNDFPPLLNKVMLEVAAEEKAKEILTMTARTLVEDILEGQDVKLEVRMQKNGRLCCTIGKFLGWKPNKVFRTSFDTFREDFARALKEYQTGTGNFCYQ